MSKRVHAATEGVVSILKSSGSFKEITGGPDFKVRARAALRGQKIHRPEAEASGFGGRPSFSVGSDFGTIKSDPDAYSKILRGESRKSAKRADRYERKALARSHRPKRPQVDTELVAKYSKKKTRKAPRRERPTPSVAMVYAYGTRSLSLKPYYSLAFKGAKEAVRAFQRGEILANSLVHFVNPRDRQPVFPSDPMKLYFYNGSLVRTI